MTTVVVMGAAARAALRRVVAQPAGLVVAGFFYLMVVSVLSGVWKVAAEVNGGAIVGYSATALVWYIATSEASVLALPLRLIDDIGTDIGSGRFTIEMLRPVPALAVRVATELGQMVPRLATCVAIGLTYAWLVGGPPASGTALLLAVPALMVGATINLLAQHAFAAAAFWFLDARGTWFLYQKLVFLLGGMLLPLEVLPAGLEAVARWLPFSAMVYVPARLASGHVEPELFLIQAFWLVVIVGFAARTFRAGEHHLLETGA